MATTDDVRAAVDAALAAHHDWSTAPWETRASVFLRAADLLSGPYRDRLNAATILGQSKSVHQAEIDAACELIDFWRWNVHFGEQLQEMQPVSSPGTWNRMDHRPLEGFVLAISPFNFTSIGGNLAGRAGDHGQHRRLEAGDHRAPRGAGDHGDPRGGRAAARGHQHDRRPRRCRLRGGGQASVRSRASTSPDPPTTFQHLWNTVAGNLGQYRTYPRLVGETGGKDFVLAHPSAVRRRAAGRPAARRPSSTRGRSARASSRAYIPQLDLGAAARSARRRDRGDPGRRSRASSAPSWARSSTSRASASTRRSSPPPAPIRISTLVAGGECDDEVGWFVHPTISRARTRTTTCSSAKLFGPILTVFPYSGLDWTSVARPGRRHLALRAHRRHLRATTGPPSTRHPRRLRYAAGNFYVNDKPTGAVVGQQPFGGRRISGTNDKAGSALNMLRWVSPRIIKETFVPPTDWRYPHQDPD